MVRADARSAIMPVGRLLGIRRFARGVVGLAQSMLRLLASVHHSLLALDLLDDDR